MTLNISSYFVRTYFWASAREDKLRVITTNCLPWPSTNQMCSSSSPSVLTVPFTPCFCNETPETLDSIVCCRQMHRLLTEQITLSDVHVLLDQEIQTLEGWNDREITPADQFLPSKQLQTTICKTLYSS